jgi:hypothetical protein
MVARRMDSSSSSAGEYLVAGGFHRHNARRIGGLRSSNVITTHPPKAWFRIASEHGDGGRGTLEFVAIQRRIVPLGLTKRSHDYTGRAGYQGHLEDIASQLGKDETGC